MNQDEERKLNVIADQAGAELAELRAEVERLNAYAMRLLSDETRTWKCKKCGEEFSSMYHGQHVIPAAEEPCPICEDGIMVPKAWVMQEEIDRLRKALSEIEESASEPGLTGQDYILQFRLSWQNVEQFPVSRRM